LIFVSVLGAAYSQSTVLILKLVSMCLMILIHD
jgi:hypothetical protein